MTGIDDNRVPPKYLLEKALVQVNTLAQQKPEDSPFALPLKKFPASISQAQQAEIRQQVLKAIATQVLPAYARFGRFLSAQYIPHGRTEPGIWSLPDGDAYYKFLVRRSTTTDLTPDADPQDRRAAGGRRRSPDAGDREEAGLRGSPGSARFDPEQSEAASDVARGADRGVPRLSGRHEAEAAAALRPAAEGAARRAAGAGLYGQEPGAGLLRAGHAGWQAARHLLREHLQLRAALADDGGGLLPITRGCRGITCRSPSRRS